MKMGKKDPRSSMSKSVKAKAPLKRGGRNPLQSPSPYETAGVGECCVPRSSPARAPAADPIVDQD